METQAIIALYAPNPNIEINQILSSAASYESHLVVIISDKHWFDQEYDFKPDLSIDIACIEVRNFENIIFPDYEIIAVVRKNITYDDLMVGSDMPTNLVHFEHPRKSVYLFYENMPTDVSDNIDHMIFIPSRNTVTYESAINTVLYDIERKETEEYENEFIRPDDDTIIQLDESE